MSRIISVWEQLRNLALTLDALSHTERAFIQRCLFEAASGDTRRLTDEQVEQVDAIWRQHCA